MDHLLDADRVGLVGPVVAEVLLGFRRKDQADWVASRLRMAHYVEASWDDWREAANLGRDLAAKGNNVPQTRTKVGALTKGVMQPLAIRLLSHPQVTRLVADLHPSELPRRRSSAIAPPADMPPPRWDFRTSLITPNLFAISRRFL